jgi:hypothetical protein
MDAFIQRPHVPQFMMRSREQVNGEDYEACKKDDPEGITVIEASLGKKLTDHRSWGDILDTVIFKANEGLLLRFQILYSGYMLAKFARILKGGDLPEQDSITLGLTYYRDEKATRTKLLSQWIAQHPADAHLLSLNGEAKPRAADSAIAGYHTTVSAKAESTANIQN